MSEVAVACSDCGRLEVVSESIYERLEQNRSPQPERDGHHAIPDDPDRDWICYGHPVAIADSVSHAAALDAFERRSIFGLAELGPTKTDLVTRGNAVEGARLGRVVDIEADAVASIAAKKTEAQSKIDSVAEQLGITRDDLKAMLADEGKTP